LEIEIKLLDAGMPIPEYAHAGDAGCDLRSAVDVILNPGARVMVPTGLSVALPEGYAGFVQPRSGLAAKHGISVVNTPGLIDSGYRGEIKVILINLDQDLMFEIKRGDKIAQFVVQKVESVVFKQVDELSDTKRGDGGFGSTGV
jgi:dUTP pyrophosphatase